MEAAWTRQARTRFTMPAQLALCSSSTVNADCAHGVVSEPWCIFKGSGWAQPLTLGLTEFSGGFQVPHNELGRPIFSPWSLTDYTLYLFSNHCCTPGVPTISLTSDGGGITFNADYGVVLFHLTPEQTSALDEGIYSVYLYVRPPDYEMPPPLLKATVVIRCNAAYFDSSTLPDATAGTATPPTIDETLVLKAMNGELITVLAGLPAGIRGTIVHGDGPPALSVGLPGQYYIDQVNDVMYGPKDAQTGWPATPIFTSGGGGAATDFASLTDTPATLGVPGQNVQVNAAGDGLEYADDDDSFTNLPDTAANIEANQIAVGDVAGNSVVFADQISGGTF